MKNYKIVCSIEYSDGHMEYVIWEPEFYGQMMYSNVSVRDLFYKPSLNEFSDQIVDVLLELWENPQVQNIMSKMGDNEVFHQICIGKKIFPINRY